MTGRGSQDAGVGAVEAHRSMLMSHCWRILGSGTDAEDAVQETILRAWRRFDQLEDSTSLRPWLKRIASNVCFDMIKAPQRRAVSVDFAVTEPDRAELTVGDVGDAVAESARVREALREVVRRLPARQRAVLILHDVLCWRANEIAELFHTTDAAVNSILQRARERLARGGCQAAMHDDGADAEQLVDAFHRHDVTSLVALLGRDAGAA